MHRLTTSEATAVPLVQAIALMYLCLFVPQNALGATGEAAQMTSTDLALQPPIINTAPEAQYGDETRLFQGIPGIERTAKGRLWATWYGGGPTEGPENYVMLNTSADDGETWSDLCVVIDPPDAVRAFDPVLWLDPLGRLWLFWAQGYSHWDGRAGVWAIVAEDPDSASPTWSAPHRLCNGIIMNKPVVLSTGEWLLPTAIWAFPPNVGDPAHARLTPDESGSNVVCSRDQGATWEFLGGSDVPDRRCDEHHVIERRDGTLWMLVRTGYGIGESFSRDRGKTWSEGQPSSIAHIPAARFFIRRLASGNLLLVKHAPSEGKARSHLTAYLSTDDGASWQGGLLIDERDGVSYPDAVQAADGTVYLIYDYSRRGEKQILMATFREEDVLAGTPMSDAVRLRVLVNQATGRKDE